MVENRPFLTLITHIVLILGIVVVTFPLWIAFVASTHDVETLLTGVTPLWPGSSFFENYGQALGSGVQQAGSPPLWLMMGNSLIMALSIAIGKIAISLISAFAIVYFRFPFRMTAFWMIFLTLMLPVEVRILPAVLPLTAELMEISPYLRALGAP